MSLKECGTGARRAEQQRTAGAQCWVGPKEEGGNMRGNGFQTEQARMDRMRTVSDEAGHQIAHSIVGVSTVIHAV